MFKFLFETSKKYKQGSQITIPNNSSNLVYLNAQWKKNSNQTHCKWMRGKPAKCKISWVTLILVKKLKNWKNHSQTYRIFMLWFKIRNTRYTILLSKVDVLFWKAIFVARFWKYNDFNFCSLSLWKPYINASFNYGLIFSILTRFYSHKAFPLSTIRQNHCCDFGDFEFFYFMNTFSNVQTNFILTFSIQYEYEFSITKTFMKSSIHQNEYFHWKIKPLKMYFLQNSLFTNFEIRNAKAFHSL